ncbi:purine-nucleoside phosphorylase [Maritalea sp. P4.10X]|uniref:purine-nucleoside phosphorylase n=1 Tax=Maritalea mediterranea TaxID=2909667 RepID=A0ABS9E3L5_9HYPH|nr:purine-nucleoside phosphorylase [Maritalea mediterranea]MCF4097459.1 purine-nucleoside phosphorylase [Maritalea mediterranea]
MRVIQERAGNEPIAAALVLGSGFAALGDMLNDPITINYDDLQGFPGGGVTGHGKNLLIGELEGKRVALLTGRAHYYEHGHAGAMKMAIQSLAGLGIDTLMLTNAAGSITNDIQPGDLMLIEDHINFSGLNPLIGLEGDKRFVDMVNAYDPVLRQKALDIAARDSLDLKQGIYTWYSGPSFETPAEIRMIQGFGARAVGMSTVPECILGRYYDMRVWGCSFITNMGAGMSDEHLSHDHTQTMVASGGERMQSLLTKMIAEL